MEKQNIKEKIKEKINKILEYNNEHLTLFLKNFNIIDCNIRKFSKNIIINYQHKDQKIYDYIVCISINKIKEVLDNNDIIFFKESKYTKINFSDIIKSKIENGEIPENIFVYKLLYLLNYSGRRRNIIHLLQINNEKYYLDNYGYCHHSFLDGYYKMEHSLTMGRFQNYKERIIQNLLKVSNINSLNNIKNIKNIKNITKNEHKIIKYNSKNNNKLFIEIYIKFNINELIPSYTKINENVYTFTNLIFVNNKINSKISSLGNVSYSIDDRLQFLSILAYCLEILNSKNSSIENTKKYIIIFYYIIILLMPFMLGTASIAEILLHSLWEKYIGSIIYINENTMLDVEALTLPFSIFYDNCFNGRTNDNYTPYIIEEDKLP